MTLGVTWVLRSWLCAPPAQPVPTHAKGPPHTLSSVSSMASSDSFSLPPFLSRLSQKEAMSSADDEPPTCLLQFASNASCGACEGDAT